MKYIISILFLMAAVAVVAVSCSKYKDKKGPAFTAAEAKTILAAPALRAA